jgi:flagellar M-ring protein FliF
MLDRFKTYSVNRQLVMAALVGLCILALLLMAWLGLRTDYAPLFKDLRAPDAAAIVGELDKKKAAYRLADEGRTVLVPSDRVDATRLELMGDDLALKGTVGFELFNKSDMGLTDFAQKINFQRALQGELERTIMSLDGVESTRVHLSLGDNRIFREDRVPPKASVTVHMQHGAQLAQSAAAGVQRLIAAAVPQLDPTDVVILDEAGQVISSDLGGAAAGSITMGSQQSAIEQYYGARIRDALQPLYPEDDVRLSVRATASPARPSDLPSQDPSALDPAARGFALRITIDLDATLPRDAKDDVRNIVQEVIAYRASRGDRIDFGPVSAAASVSAPLAPMPRQPSVPDRDGPIYPAPTPAGVQPAGLWVAAITGMLAIVLLVGWRRTLGRSRPLSAGDRQRLINSLNSLAGEEGGNHGARG